MRCVILSHCSDLIVMSVVLLGLEIKCCNKFQFSIIQCDEMLEFVCQHEHAADKS